MIVNRFIKMKIVWFLLFGSFAFVSASGTNGLAFLKIDVDGRSAAMGGAYTALASGASAAYWNPAGLADSENENVMLTHLVWLSDITQEYSAVKFNSGRHHFSLAVNVFNIPGIEIRGEAPSAEPDGTVDAVNFYSAFGYARSFGKKWQAGLTLKYLFQKLYLVSANGFAFDFGIKYHSVVTGLDWGFTVQNMGKMEPLQKEATPLPLLVRSGFAYHLPFQLFGENPLLAADIEYVKEEETSLRIGTELPLMGGLSYRLGFHIAKDRVQWSTGVGLNYKTFYFDYAFAPDPFDLGTSHRLTLGLYF